MSRDERWFVRLVYIGGIVYNLLKLLFYNLGAEIISLPQQLSNDMSHLVVCIPMYMPYVTDVWLFLEVNDLINTSIWNIGGHVI